MKKYLFSEIIRFLCFSFQRRFPEALALGLSFYQDKGKAVVGLRGSKQRRKQIARDKVCQVLVQYMEELNQCSIEDTADSEIVSTCVDYCVQLENTELLFGRLWDLVAESEGLKAGYLRALEAPLLDGSLPPRLPPLVAQHLVALYDHEERMDSLQAIAVLLDVDCLDIHQVINNILAWDEYRFKTSQFNVYTEPKSYLFVPFYRRDDASLHSKLYSYILHICFACIWNCSSSHNALKYI